MHELQWRNLITCFLFFGLHNLHQQSKKGQNVTSFAGAYQSIPCFLLLLAQRQKLISRCHSRIQVIRGRWWPRTTNTLTNKWICKLPLPNSSLKKGEWDHKSHLKGLILEGLKIGYTASFTGSWQKNVFWNTLWRRSHFLPFLSESKINVGSESSTKLSNCWIISSVYKAYFALFAYRIPTFYPLCSAWLRNWTHQAWK